MLWVNVSSYFKYAYLVNILMKFKSTNIIFSYFFEWTCVSYTLPWSISNDFEGKNILIKEIGSLPEFVLNLNPINLY